MRLLINGAYRVLAKPERSTKKGSYSISVNVAFINVI